MTDENTEPETLDGPSLGTGIYSMPEVARIVERGRDISRDQIKRWMAVVRPPTQQPEALAVITFLDLIGLEMVCRLRDQGFTLQFVRKVLSALHERHPHRNYPLAHESFYTDGRFVWQEDGNVSDASEQILGGTVGQMAMTAAIETFAHQIRFVDNQAASWDISEWIEVNPHVQFGAPVIAGTRIPVDTIVSCLEHDTPAEVARGFEISVTRVNACADFYSRAA